MRRASHTQSGENTSYRAWRRTHPRDLSTRPQSRRSFVLAQDDRAGVLGQTKRTHYPRLPELPKSPGLLILAILAVVAILAINRRTPASSLRIVPGIVCGSDLESKLLN